MKRLTHALSCLAAGFIAGGAALAADAPITVFTAKRVITMEPAMPRAKMIAVRDGRILGVGDSLDDLSAWLDGADYTVDSRYEDDVITPGLIDPHLHPIMAAVLLPMTFITPEGWDLPGGASLPSQTPEDYRARLSAAIAGHEGAAPFFTWGYHQLWHGDLDRTALDAMEPLKPVVVWHRSFHEIILNSAALTMLGLGNATAFDAAIAASHADPGHADLARGHVSETALAAVLPRLGRFILAPDWLAQGFADLKAMARMNGVTMIADMATGLFAGFDAERAMIEGAFGGADAAMRVMLVPDATTLAREKGSPAEAAAYVASLPGRADGDLVFTNRRIKLFADGAFFSQYMQMGAPGYTDGHEGKWITEPDAFAGQAEAFWKEGVTIHWHVNGDAGLDAVLDVIAALEREHPWPEHRLTLEHLGFSREDQNRRIADLDVLVSAQPNYVYVLGQKYAERGLGYDRASQMSRLGSLERFGVTVALHSDLTMAPVDPLFLAWIAATRVNMEGAEMAQAERLSVDAALRAVTINAAYVLGLENEIGSIAAGKRADFTVLGADPYRKGAKGLKDIEVKGVVFDGRAVQVAPQAAAQ